MVTRLKKFLACLIAFTLLTPAAMAATKSPTPKPTAKATATASAKPMVSAKATAKATTTAKATKKAVVKKKPVKKKPRKKVLLSPSPKPEWPLFGFKSDDGEIWAKIPTAKELIGNASNNKNLTRELARLVDGVRVCEKYSCGAVQVASENGCTWWDITAKVSDATKVIYGSIRRTVGASEPRQMVTVLLASQEDITKEHIVTGINITCHHDAPDTKVPFTQYFPTEG
ncbi:unannotated protein [freshwater metagenome]|uniref:Unannotated protein n=1 Tax=freshwater metagenome TaxID=449393 RepID=A0A6J7QDU0_9ZZZZ